MSSKQNKVYLQPLVVNGPFYEPLLNPILSMFLHNNSSLILKRKIAK